MGISTSTGLDPDGSAAPTSALPTSQGNASIVESCPAILDSPLSLTVIPHPIHQQVQPAPPSDGFITCLLLPLNALPHPRPSLHPLPLGPSQQPLPGVCALSPLTPSLSPIRTQRDPVDTWVRSRPGPAQSPPVAPSHSGERTEFSLWPLRPSMVHPATSLTSAPPFCPTTVLLAHSDPAAWDSLNMPNTFSPQDPCTGCSLCLEHTFPAENLMARSFPSYRSVSKCPLLKEAVPDTLFTTASPAPLHTHIHTHTELLIPLSAQLCSPDFWPFHTRHTLHLHPVHGLSPHHKVSPRGAGSPAPSTASRTWHWVGAQ